MGICRAGVNAAATTPAVARKVRGRKYFFFEKRNKKLLPVG
jgi:hypothetical protein